MCVASGMPARDLSFLAPAAVALLVGLNADGSVATELPTYTAVARRSVTLEELNRALVLFGRSSRLERAEIPTPSGSRIGLSRVQAVFPRPELSNHETPSSSPPQLADEFMRRHNTIPCKI